MKECIDIKTLVKRVLDFLGLEMHLLSNAKQVMLFDIESDDVVTCMFETDNGYLIEMPVEHAVKHAVNIDGPDLAARIFIDRLGSIKFLSYGMDVETLKPKKTVENPFFRMRSLEEIAMKLDLLGAWNMINSRKRDIQEKTLKRACRCLGFHLVKHRDFFKIYDDRDREYKRFPFSKSNSDGISGISTVEDFLETEWFEHYHFSSNELIDDRLNIIENPFFGKSREQLEIELDLLEVWKSREMKTHMNENEARKLVLGLLREYGDAEVLEAGIADCCSYCKPVFTSNLFWHTIYIRTSTGDFSRRKVLKGKDMVEVVSAIWKTFKDGGSLESELKKGDYVIIKLGSKAGAVEKFLLEYEMKNVVK